MSVGESQETVAYMGDKIKTDLTKIRCGGDRTAFSAKTLRVPYKP